MAENPVKEESNETMNSHASSQELRGNAQLLSHELPAEIMNQADNLPRTLEQLASAIRIREQQITKEYEGRIQILRDHREQMHDAAKQMIDSHIGLMKQKHHNQTLQAKTFVIYFESSLLLAKAQVNQLKAENEALRDVVPNAEASLSANNEELDKWQEYARAASCRAEEFFDQAEDAQKKLEKILTEAKQSLMK